MSTKAEEFVWSWQEFNAAAPERKRQMAQEYAERCPDDPVARGLAHKWSTAETAQEPLSREDEMLLVARKFNEAVDRERAPYTTIRVELTGIARFACWWFVIASAIGLVAAMVAASH